MSAYKMYFRTEKGLILRHGNVTFYRTGPLYPFVHEELLTEWPEPKVLWVEETGESYGLAEIPPSSLGEGLQAK